MRRRPTVETVTLTDWLTHSLLTHSLTHYSLARSLTHSLTHLHDVKPVSKCFRFVVCLNSSIPGDWLSFWRVTSKQFWFWETIQLACSEVSFSLLEINLPLTVDFLAYPIKWTSDTWCFVRLYLLCGSFQALRSVAAFGTPRPIPWIWFTELAEEFRMLLPLTQSKAGACDQEAFVENSIGQL